MAKYIKLLTLCFVTSTAFAGGFDLIIQNAGGTSYSSTASLKDASVVYFNPAILPYVGESYSSP
jgi:hypothetical protein